MARDLGSLDGSAFDVAVIGGGINGASSAQHLSAAGFSVLLVDKGDFASGSSGRSTRMLHCGLRYFETPRPLLDFALAPRKLAVAVRMAREAMALRDEIVTDSPSRVRPVKLCFPLYRNGPYKGWHLDLAFRMLGAFGTGDVPLDYERLSGTRARKLPLVDQLRDLDALRSVAVFTEYMLDWPERFCIDAVLDAERMGALVRNYTKARLVRRDGKGIWRLELTDEQSGGETATVTAPIVLNMAGIWIDQVNETAPARPRRLVLGTKGAHIVVRLPPEFRDTGIATINRVGEPYYCLPSRGGYHHIGPTETVHEGDIDDIRVDEADLAFLVRETNAVLPGLGLDENDVVYSWAGVRPLTFDPAYPKGKRSREIHDLDAEGLPGVYAMTAGPITTHRSAGRDMTEVVRGVLRPTRGPRRPEYAPRQWPDARNSPPLVEGDPTVRLADLAHVARTEHAVTLADILFAHTGAGYAHQLTGDEVRRAAEAVSVELGWAPEEVDRQIANLDRRARTLYRPPDAWPLQHGRAPFHP